MSPASAGDVAAGEVYSGVVLGTTSGVPFASDVRGAGSPPPLILNSLTYTRNGVKVICNSNSSRSMYINYLICEVHELNDSQCTLIIYL